MEKVPFSPPTGAATRDEQFILSFNPKATPIVDLAATPDVSLSPEGPCVDKSRLPDSGRLPAAHIQARIREAAVEMRACYERGLGRDPNLSGKVVTRFRIGVDGLVESVHTDSSSIPDCEVVVCLRGAFGRLRFEAPKGGPVTVVYPFRLEPEL